MVSEMKPATCPDVAPPIRSSTSAAYLLNTQITAQQQAAQDTALPEAARLDRAPYIVGILCMFCGG
jgi:hypothetical protein